MTSYIDTRRLFGIVNRTHSNPDKPKLLCHVLEADASGSSVSGVYGKCCQADLSML